MESRKRRSLPVIVSALAALLLAVIAVVPVLAQGPGDGPGQSGPGMMGGGMGMMGGQGAPGSGCPMGGLGMMGPGMTEGFAPGNPFANPSPKPLSLDDSIQAVEKYLADVGDPNLELAEVMVFDNHSYARIVEKDTGIGAMELLVDPVTLDVYPEMGPNMMWNQKYGMMSGGHGMMSWGFRGRRPPVSTEMTTSPEQALAIAQDYLDRAHSGSKLQVAEDADAFYGYYTIDVEQDDMPVGMLSVNGYNGQVFSHTWHGKFVEMKELEQEGG